MVLYRRITLKAKEEHVVWFVKTDDMPSAIANAKLQQMHDWIRAEHPFGSKFGVIIVPSDTNKISILKSKEEFCKDFQGDPDKWLDTVQDKLENCLTIHLSIQKNLEDI